MYTMEQAEQLAVDFLREASAGSDHPVSLFQEDRYKAQKGEFFFFSYQSVKFLTTGDKKYLLYGAPAISVHGVTGECRFVSYQDLQAAGDPFNMW
ncbi:hypothetical protein [Streptomyces sp. NPDC046197]|uniref:hypothetical protein n=1 Tax=Streptomyces sp. NPDC046197 TaxID=3154337 RepID=UPI0033C22F69